MIDPDIEKLIVEYQIARDAANKGVKATEEEEERHRMAMRGAFDQKQELENTVGRAHRALMDAIHGTKETPAVGP